MRLFRCGPTESPMPNPRDNLSCIPSLVNMELAARKMREAFVCVEEQVVAVKRQRHDQHSRPREMYRAVGRAIAWAL